MLGRQEMGYFVKIVFFFFVVVENIIERRYLNKNIFLITNTKHYLNAEINLIILKQALQIAFIYIYIYM